MTAEGGSTLGPQDHEPEREVPVHVPVHRLGGRLRDRPPARAAHGRELALRRDRPDRPVQRLLHHDGLPLGGDRGVAPSDPSPLLRPRSLPGSFDSPDHRASRPPRDHRAIIRPHADCIDFMRRSRPLVRSHARNRRLARVDAQEIKTAVAHQEAARTAAEAPFVNLADPARALGPNGAPAVSRRAPIWEDVPDEKWNDWRWQLSNRVNDLEEIEQILELTDEEREGLSVPGQVPGRHHALLHEPDRPEGPQRPDPAAGHPDRPRARRLHRDDGGLARRGPPLPGPGPRPSLPGPRPDAGHDPVRELLPLLHPVADRRRPDPELQSQGPRGAARVPAPDPAGPRRPDLRRRRPDARPEALRIDPQGPARDPAHRDHPDREPRAGLPAAADRRRAVRDAREVPPALDQPPLQPPERDHARGLSARSTS